MITLNAKINIVEEHFASLTSATNMEVGSSISKDLSGVLDTDNAETPFITTQVCDENGNFESPNLITINGYDIASVNVVFDKNNNQYPKSIYASNLTEKKTVSFTLEGRKIGTTGLSYSYEEYIDVGSPILSVTIISRTPHWAIPSTTNNPTLTSSTIKVSSADNKKIFLYEVWSNAITVDYVLEVEVLSEERLNKITVSSPVVNITVGKPTDRIIFIVSDWNTPNSAMAINGIYLPKSQKVDYYIKNINMRGLSSTIRDRKDEELPSYGVVSNSGSLQFIDYDGRIEDYITNDIVGENMQAQIFLLNTLTHKKEVVGYLYTEKWDYDNDDKNVSVSLVDDLIELQNIKFLGMPLKDTMTVYDLYEYLRGITPSKFEFEALDEETTSYMKSVKCNNPYIEEGSLWRAYDKLCQIGALHIYKNNNKVIVKHLI